MKTVDVKSSTHIDFDKNNSKEDPKFKVGDHVRISKYKNIFENQKNRKPNKIWVDKGSEFYNNSFKKWLQGNDIVIYSTHNEGKSVVAERFIRILKNKQTHDFSIKNVYMDQLDDIVNEYNNTYHRTIKMKPIDVKNNTYLQFFFIKCSNNFFTI